MYLSTPHTRIPNLGDEERNRPVWLLDENRPRILFFFFLVWVPSLVVRMGGGGSTYSFTWEKYSDETSSGAAEKEKK